MSEVKQIKEKIERLRENYEEIAEKFDETGELNMVAVLSCLGELIEVVEELNKKIERLEDFANLVEFHTFYKTP